MDVLKYLKLGEHYNSAGHKTDGCTFIGWIVHKIWPKLEKACWSHDYGRRGLIKFEDGQYENDLTFRSALKHLGAPRPLRALMFIAVRFQGITKLDPAIIAGILFITSFVGFAIWHSSI